MRGLEKHGRCLIDVSLASHWKDGIRSQFTGVASGKEHREGFRSLLDTSLNNVKLALEGAASETLAEFLESNGIFGNVIKPEENQKNSKAKGA